MPVPKGKQKEFGILVATFQKRGMSLAAAKKKADEIIRRKKPKKK